MAPRETFHHVHFRRIAGRGREPFVAWVALTAALASAPRPAAATPNVAQEAMFRYISTTEPKIATKPSIVDRVLCHKITPVSGGGCSDDAKLTAFGLAVKGHTGCPLPFNTSTGGEVTKEKFMAAFAALDAEQADTDCDGFSDIDEIRAGVDPNVPGQHPQGTPPLTTSCLQAGSGGGAGSAGQGGIGGGSSSSGDTDGDGGNDAGTAQSDDDGKASPPAASSCTLSSPARPLDPTALFFAALAALPLTRRALRPRRRPTRASPRP